MYIHQYEFGFTEEKNTVATHFAILYNHTPMLSMNNIIIWKHPVTKQLKMIHFCEQVFSELLYFTIETPNNYSYKQYIAHVE